MKKKLLVLNIGVVLAIVITFVCMLASGGEYTQQTRTFYGADDRMTGAELVCETEGIIELTDAYLNNGQTMFEFKAVGRGRTKGVINYTVAVSGADTDPGSIHTFSVDIGVNMFGMVVDHTMGLSFSGYRVAIFAVLFVLILTVVITLWIYVKAILRGEFDYSMVSFGGIGIFAMSLFAFTVYKMQNNSVHVFSDFTWLALDIGTLLFIALMPLMLLLAAFMAFSNIWLMRHEGYRPANALGIIFAVLWFVGTGVLLGVELDVFGYWIPTTVVKVVIFIADYLECIFLATAVSTVLATMFRVPYDKDYIIILGCRIRKDGTLTPLLKGRVDRALKFEQAQYEKTRKHAVFVPSGGQGPDEVMAEGQAMENYLIEQGVPAERVKREDKSTNTLQNMAYSKKVIEADCRDISQKKVAFSTTNYHVFRGYVLAKKCGFEAQGLSAKTKGYFYPNAFLREFVGLLVDQKLRHIGYIAVMVLAVVLMYYRLI